MSDSQQVPKAMILTGAGVSVPIGIPAMKGLYENFLQKRKSGITDPEKRICRLLTEELGVSPDLEEFLIQLNAMCDFDDSSLSQLVEKAVSPIANSRKLEVYRRLLTRRLNRLREVKQRILKYCTKVCFEFDRNRSVQIFQGLINAVALRGYPVFTTNYDFAFEHVAGACEVQIENNFKPTGKGVAQRWIWKDELDFPIGNALTLVKLHGSVTWYRNENGTVESIQFDTTKNHDGQDVSRQVVFPTRFKDIYAQHYFGLYSYFLSTLAQVEVLVIVGHSLRDEYLRAGIVNEYRKGCLNIVVVDPHFPNVLFKELGIVNLNRTHRITHVPTSIEEFADELASVISERSSEEMIDHIFGITKFRRHHRKKLSIKGRLRTLRVGNTVKFCVNVKVFLLPDQKPAALRVWLESEAESGKRTGTSFLEKDLTRFSIGSSGVIDQEYTMEFDVPNVTNWRDSQQVILRVGLCRESKSNPWSMGNEDLFLLGERTFVFRRD